MGDKTKIPWADATWNPVTGCTQIAAGCKNCYAKRQFPRVYGNRDFGDVRFHEDRLRQPERWKRPRRIFVCSMGDLFHKDVDHYDIQEVWAIMMKNKHHTYIVLTKRPGRMMQWTNDNQYETNGPAWPPHIHIGVSISTQEDADALIPTLLSIPAVIRIVSVEPALEHIDISQYLNQTEGISGVIMGSEKLSGGRPGRPFSYNWAADLKDQCTMSGYSPTPFFFKQAPVNGRVVEMPMLCGKVWDQLPRR